ncbi:MULTISPECIES: alanine racemase [unclassified Meiothermus]|uniref:alanine racemase n=1 Tax=unclassified Meiothermus TaxID=370471 RepID=UPI000D7CD9E7|nr:MULTISPECIES: alanine racemase [unclassified Meiothermus]PZA06255.1 alanine racemase [Meiothermus sp. Pnk-1]RYM39528.1 alanine racemase [Meiothermus sp. PNK-Is4]
MRPAWLEINLDSLAHNVALLRSKTLLAQLVGVVKANAYGHGAVPIGKELLRLGAWGLAVATVDEGRELRLGGIQGRVLLMGSLHPDQAREALEADLIASLSTFEGAQALDAAARALGKIAEVHLEFDTGMGRVGFPWEEAQRVKEALERFSHLKVTGLYSHFADAEENPEFTRMQLAHFRRVQEVWGPGYFCHLANSAGVFNLRDYGFDAIRPGIALYGLLPNLGLKPIARLLAKPTLVKQLPPGRKIGYSGLYTTRDYEWIATLPVGYADGMPRLAYNRATVRLSQPSGAGWVCPVVGRISMDQVTVRIPGPVNLDAVFEVLTADFDPGSSLWGWAEMTGTVSYEPAVRLAARLPRVYLRGGVEVARVEP